jgi:hypothetical protein
MCTADEDNLKWLKGRVARGWFEIAGSHGVAADRPPGSACSTPMATRIPRPTLSACLRPRRIRRDQFAELRLLSDRVSVRAGAPQTYGTQMECVDGEWLAPNIESPAELDARLRPWDCRRTASGERAPPPVRQRQPR